MCMVLHNTAIVQPLHVLSMLNVISSVSGIAERERGSGLKTRALDLVLRNVHVQLRSCFSLELPDWLSWQVNVLSF